MSLTLGEIAVRYGCELQGDPDAEVCSVATLSQAVKGSIGFLANPAYRGQLADTQATAVILAPEDAGVCPVNALVTLNPYGVYARVAQELYPQAPVIAGVHPLASVATDATIGAGCEIAAGAAIGAGVVLGDGCYIGPNCVMEAGAAIGAGGRLVANVTVCHGVRIGARCLIHPGTVIGADGFGMAQSDTGWIKVPQVGSVVLGDDVEIGANSCIDRGAIGDTRLGNDVKIDNQVQIAHNVVVGDHTAIAGQVGIAGSTVIGSRCMIGGAARVSGHIEIAAGTVVMGSGNVSRSITQPGTYSSVLSVEEAGKWRKIQARVKRLDAMAGRLRQVESALKALTGNKDKAE